MTILSTHFLVLIILIQLFLSMIHASTTSTKSFVPAIYFFGDSLADTGNNNYIRTVTRANFRPYGMDFNGGKCTGRFSNGMVVPDFLASILGIKELLPPYLDHERLKTKDLLTGVSFASGGTGYDPDIPKLTNVLSMPKQIELLKEYKQKITDIIGETETKKHLENSVFMIVCGSNDGMVYFYDPRKHDWISIIQYAEFLKEKAISFLEDMIKIGAKKIGILAIPPIGCTPFARNIFGGESKNCSSSFNELAKIYNEKLHAEIEHLNTKYETRLFVIDMSREFKDLVTEPAKYGFEVSLKGCCGLGITEVSVTCNFASKICSNTSAYVFFDAFHPTEQASKILAQGMIQKYSKHFL